MKKFLAMVLAVGMIFTLAACGSSDSDESTEEEEEVEAEEEESSEETEEAEESESAGEEAEAAETESAEEEEAEEESEEVEIQDAYYVGDTLLDGELQIVYTASGVYTDYSEYNPPEDGYQYIYLEFACENTSESDDDSITYYSFECYADGYSVDAYYPDDNNLSATLSPGRTTTGRVYFEVPAAAQEVEVEYSPNLLDEEKITFVYEGEADSGYVVEANTTATEGAYSVGDVIEADGLTITYVSCELYTPEEEYNAAEEGYHYVTCTFEFENTGDEDESASCYDFDCYADGADCSQNFSRDDYLSATISSGHKAQGTVTFEVPDDAAVVEVEYVTSYWTSSRLVFTCEY